MNLEPIYGAVSSIAMIFKFQKHITKDMFKIFQARLQQFMNLEM